MSAIELWTGKDTGQGTQAALPHVSEPDRRESSDAYHAVVVVLNDRWRVIDSCEPYPYRQWILQYRDKNGPLGWTTRPPYGSFCQTRAALECSIREKAHIGISLDGLPARIAAARAHIAGQTPQAAAIAAAKLTLPRRQG